MKDGMNEELRPTKTFTEKAAETIGDLLVGSVNSSRAACVSLMVAEPKYPVNLLKEDLND